MENITLDERDRAVLERLREGETDVDALAEGVGADREYLDDRLPKLADNGLVEREGDTYVLTDDGNRVIEASATGEMDDRIDTPPKVEGRILAFDLPPDRESALRGAFAFLQYWGEASAGEIVDGVYSETPAGFDSPTEWWRECVRDRLAELPRVEPSHSADEPWRYDGTPVVEESGDGRDVAGPEVASETSVRFALSRLDFDDGARLAVRRVFDLLVEVGEVSATEAIEQVYPDHDAGYSSPTEWWDECVGPAFESLPGVERVDGDRERWRYHAVDTEPPSA